MRKILIGVLIVVLIASIAFTLINGIAIGNVQISSIKQLAEKDKELEDNIRNLKNMKEVTFSDSIEQLEQENKRLKSKREEYSALINNAEGEVANIISAEKYQIEYLWVKLGNYATKNGVTLKLNILNSSTGVSGVYDLSFTLNGGYAGITEYIYEIENDYTLGFKIEKFLLVPGGATKSDSKENENKENENKENENKEKQENTNTDILTATFTVKDIEIDIPAGQISNVTNELKDNVTLNNENTETQNTVDSASNTITQ